MKKKPARTIRLLRPPADDDPGIFQITIGKKSSFYVYQEITCEIGGRGFAVHRLGIGPLYHLRIHTPEDSSCDCTGFLQHGHCKHVQGLAALLARQCGEFSETDI